MALVLEEIAQAGKRKDILQQVEAFLDEAMARIREGKPWTWDELRLELRRRLAGGGG